MANHKTAPATTPFEDLLEACEFTLNLLDNLSTGEFSIGGDRPARLKLSAALARAKGEPACYDLFASYPS
jgi:hypothetical protein